MKRIKKKRIMISVPVNRLEELKREAIEKDTTISKILLSASETTEFVTKSIPLDKK